MKCNYLDLSPFADARSLVGRGTIVAFDVGWDELLYIAVALKPLDYWKGAPGETRYPKTIADTPQDYRLIALRKGGLEAVTNIFGEIFNIHHVQRIVEDKVLFVCSRSVCHKTNEYEKNGRIYGIDGAYQTGILLGDGIHSAQVDSAGIIWTSYFDEGVAGNLGWDTPVGSSGLNAWDADGNIVYTFEAADGADSILDCYALNVASPSDVWFYYYLRFSLVHLHNREIRSVWEMPVSGSDGFAVYGNLVLFRGGYDDQDTYYLYRLGEKGRVQPLKRLQLVDPSGQRITAEYFAARRDTLYILSKGRIYTTRLRVIVDNLLKQRTVIRDSASGKTRAD